MLFLPYLVKDKEDDENNIGKQIGLSPDMPSKEVLKMVIDDKKVYYRLRKEYIMSGHRDKKGLLIKLKRNARNDLIYFIEHGVDYEVVQQIMRCHYKSSKDNPYSYIQDKRACMEVEKIKRSISTSISTKIYEKVLDELEMERQSGRQIKFSSKSEIDEYLDRLFGKVELEYKSTNIRGREFRKLLNIEFNKSNGKREYKIIGFMDEKALKDKYGLNKIV